MACIEAHLQRKQLFGHLCAGVDAIVEWTDVHISCGTLRI